MLGPVSTPAPEPNLTPISEPVSEPVPEQLALDRAVEPVSEPLAPQPALTDPTLSDPASEPNLASSPEMAPALVSESTPVMLASSEPASEPATMQVPESATTSKSVVGVPAATVDGSVATEPEAGLESLTTGMLRLVDGLLHSRSERATDLLAQVRGSVTGLVRFVEELLGGLLGGGEAPGSADNTLSAPAVLEGFAAAILRLVEGLLSSDGVPTSVDDLPSAPAVPAPPVPRVASPTDTFLSASKVSDSAYLVLGILGSFSILLLEGRFSWPSRELLRPNSVALLALERPG
jgi:hypothetical protein